LNTTWAAAGGKCRIGMPGEAVAMIDEIDVGSACSCRANAMNDPKRDQSINQVNITPGVQGRQGAFSLVHPRPARELTRTCESSWVNLLSRFNLMLAVQSCLKKHFRSHLTQITSISLAVSPHMRGVSRSSRTRGGMRWTRQRRAHRQSQGELNLVSDLRRADERCCFRFH
jgi:hypothetical protein